jgi:hypothetical protein
MVSRKATMPKAQLQKQAPMDVSAAVQKVLEENPEVRLVLEIAARARDVESRDPPRYIGIATDVIAIPTNSQYPVS